jgi:hypothetical protein
MSRLTRTARSIGACAAWISSGVLLIAASCSSQEAVPWRFNLRAGDHLIYEYVFERTVPEGEVQTKTRAQYSTHALVLGERSGHLSLGFERNRQSAELLEYTEKNKDQLAQQRPAFQKRTMARPTRFAEANEISSSGLPLLAWTVERETGSHIIMAVHELEGLPEQPVKPGDSWKGVNLLGFDFRFAAVENVNGKACNRVEGTSRDVRAHLNYWWCPSTGQIAKLDFEGEYRAFAGLVHETAKFELKEVRHGEAVEQWLGSPDTQKATLEALVLSDWVALPPKGLEQVLASRDPATQGLALALMVRRKLDIKTLDARAQSQIMELSRSGAGRVAPLAARLLEPEKADKTKASEDGTSSSKQCAPPHHYALQRPGTSGRIMHDSRYAGQVYMLRIPEEYRGDRPFPLLIVLSGGAGYAIDGVNSSEDTVAKTNYIVLYPQAGDLWWKTDIAIRVDALLREVGDELNIDPSRVYITGFSNGGTGALYYATLWPQRFAAVASLMGLGQCLPAIAEGLTQVNQLPILLVHGDKDPLIQADCSRNTYDALQKLSPRIAPELHILKDRAHDVTLDTDDGLTLPFFEKYTRVAPPQRISMRMPDLTFPRRYWVEILDKSNGMAEVNGQIKPNNTVELSTRNVKKLRVLLRPEIFAAAGPVRIVVDKKEAFRGEVKWCGSVFDPVAGAETGIDLNAGR